jgi:DNA-binding transcriptional ArsR family regulator
MLEALFGTKTIEEILLFCFVNTQAYATQIRDALTLSLTPVQKALERLERGGILTSHFEGKTRLYQLNSGYPLHRELEALLKKRLELCSHKEKKCYLAVKKETSLSLKAQDMALICFWKRLESVQTLVTSSRSKGGTASSESGQGKASVFVEKVAPDVIIFHEKGYRQTKTLDRIDCTNVFRWSFDRLSGFITLEHLRHGKEHPVFLFHLVPISSKSLSCIDSHACGEDSYFGHIAFDEKSIRLSWHILGPRKNQELLFHYM